MKYLEIKKDDLIFNIEKLKQHCAPAKIIAVLKGNAYGLDMVKMGQVLLENGVDIYTIATLLGHKSVTSTQVYARLSPAQVREAVMRL